MEQWVPPKPGQHWMEWLVSTMQDKETWETKYANYKLDTFASPNPTTGEFEVIFKEPPGKIIIEIFSTLGTLIYREDFREYAGRKLRISALNRTDQGLYFVRLRTGTGVYLHKIIKLND